MAPIRISSSQGINDDQLTHCHIVPCKIHYSGPAKVSKYFNVKSHNGQPVSYFRGRKLLGHQINLDEKYIGAVIQESEVDLRRYHEDDEEAEMTDQEPTRNFSTVEYFSDIIVWGHETIPDIKRDPWISGLTDFISLAHLIHDHSE